MSRDTSAADEAMRQRMEIPECREEPCRCLTCAQIRALAGRPLKGDPRVDPDSTVNLTLARATIDAERERVRHRIAERQAKRRARVEITCDPKDPIAVAAASQITQAVAAHAASGAPAPKKSHPWNRRRKPTEPKEKA